MAEDTMTIDAIIEKPPSANLSRISSVTRARTAVVGVRRATWLVGAALVVSSWFVERYALRVALTGTGFPLVWAAGFMYRRQRRALRQPSHPE